MKDNINKYIEIIAPVLRGLSFNGEKGKIVKYIENKNSAKCLTDIYKQETLYINPVVNDISSGISVAEKKVIKQLVDEYNNYTTKHDKQPVLVMLDSIGLFIIGETYEDLNNILGNKPDINKSEKKADKYFNRYDRNLIVKNKVSAVTGSAQGIGREIVLGLVEAGSIVFIADINLEGAKKLSEQLNEQYKKIVSFPVKVNITDEDSVKNMVTEIIKKAGGIDIFINNAGVLKAGGVMEMDLNDFSFVSNVNYTGYFLCAKYVSRIMALQNNVCNEYYTDIIQINSKSGLAGSKRNSAYAGSKFGGIGLTQSFALELVDCNIKVNSICPGNFFDGPLWSDPDKGLFAQYLKVGKVPGAKTFDDVKKFYESKVPMKRGCTGKDLVKAIFYIVDQKYETGQAIPVTGGQVMLK